MEVTQKQFTMVETSTILLTVSNTLWSNMDRYQFSNMLSDFGNSGKKKVRAIAYYAREGRATLRRIFPDKWIGIAGATNRSAKSLNLTPLGFFPSGANLIVRLRNRD